MNKCISQASKEQAEYVLCNHCEDVKSELVLLVFSHQMEPKCFKWKEYKHRHLREERWWSQMSLYYKSSDIQWTSEINQAHPWNLMTPRQHPNSQ